MSADGTRQHYDRLAATFDENWAYTPAFVEWMTGCILRRLDIGPRDVVADIGCGTGLYARGLAGRASAVVCVDASRAMLGQIPAAEGLVTVCATVEEVASGRVPLPYERFDVMLLKEVLHHVDDRAGAVAGLARLLAPGGRMLVAMLPARIEYPLFAEALARYEARQPDPEDIAAAMRAAGLAVQVSYDSFPLVFPAERYLGMVRNRYMSLLSRFSDERLEAGIEEIRRTHPGAEIAFTDTFAFVLGSAP